MSKIVIHIDEGGIFQGLYVTKDIADWDPQVELIDFCTDDPDEIEATEQAYTDVLAKEKAGKLIKIDDYYQRRAGDDDEEETEEEDEKDDADSKEER